MSSEPILLEDKVRCFGCKGIQEISQLKVTPGALIAGSESVNRTLCQNLYLCGCGKVLVCDTNGVGNLVLQNLTQKVG